jgi:hypothetical protein
MSGFAANCSAGLTALRISDSVFALSRLIWQVGSVGQSNFDSGGGSFLQRGSPTPTSLASAARISFLSRVPFSNLNKLIERLRSPLPPNLRIRKNDIQFAAQFQIFVLNREVSGYGQNRTPEIIATRALLFLCKRENGEIQEWFAESKQQPNIFEIPLAAKAQRLNGAVELQRLAPAVYPSPGGAPKKPCGFVLD